MRVESLYQRVMSLQLLVPAQPAFWVPVPSPETHRRDPLTARHMRQRPAHEADISTPVLFDEDVTRM